MRLRAQTSEGGGGGKSILSDRFLSKSIECDFRKIPSNSIRCHIASGEFYGIKYMRRFTGEGGNK